MSLISYLGTHITKEFLLEILKNEDSLMENGPIRTAFKIWHERAHKDIEKYYVNGFHKVHQRKIIEWIRIIIQDELDDIEQKELFNKYNKNKNTNKRKIIKDKNKFNSDIIVHKRRKIEPID